jgi:serpin B
MKMSSPAGRIGVLVSLLLTTGYAAEQPAERLVPNYIAVKDASLSAADGSPRGVLKKGTLVEARDVRGKLDVRAADGKAGLAGKNSFSRLGSSVRITPEALSVATSSNQFAFDLYQRVRRKEGNLFLSPGSISTALAMTYAGAAGQTKQEMAGVLHFQPDQKIDEGYATFLALLNSTGDLNGYSLSTANRLWGAADYKFAPGFLSLTRDSYGAELQSLDFKHPEEARRTINGWAEEQTREKIVDLIPSGVLKTDTRLVLTNAIYFEGGWQSEFSKNATKKLPFHETAQDKRDVLTMYQQEKFPYTEDADAQVLSLPYRGHELSMVIALPKKVDGLADLESGLSEERFANWIKTMRGNRPVDVYLPKFKMRSEFLLSQALGSMGMSLAFSENADFSLISPQEALKISEVVHQAFVDVDEEGTEAAAATAVIFAPTAAPFEPREPPKPILFRADHPFLFAIRDNRTGAVLFIGRVQHPKV